MKKLTSVFLTGALLALVLTGCAHRTVVVSPVAPPVVTAVVVDPAIADRSLDHLLPSSQTSWKKDLGADTVVLDVTRSSNTPAYRITIKRNGDASYEWGPDRNVPRGGKKHAKAPAALTAKVFQDLQATWPQLLGATPHRVMKSTSLGHYSYITYRGVHCADLESLQHDPGAQALDADFVEVLNILVK